MTIVDATIALLLAARIHGSNEAVKTTAKRCAKQLPRSKRDLMFSVIDSSNPLLLVDFLAKNLD